MGPTIQQDECRHMTSEKDTVYADLVNAVESVVSHQVRQEPMRLAFNLELLRGACHRIRPTLSSVWLPFQSVTGPEVRALGAQHYESVREHLFIFGY